MCQYSNQPQYLGLTVVTLTVRFLLLGVTCDQLIGVAAASSALSYCERCCFALPSLHGARLRRSLHAAELRGCSRSALVWLHLTVGAAWRLRPTPRPGAALSDSRLCFNWGLASVCVGMSVMLYESSCYSGVITYFNLFCFL